MYKSTKLLISQSNNEINNQNNFLNFFWKGSNGTMGSLRATLIAVLYSISRFKHILQQYSVCPMLFKTSNISWGSTNVHFNCHQPFNSSDRTSCANDGKLRIDQNWYFVLNKQPIDIQRRHINWRNVAITGFFKLINPLGIQNLNTHSTGNQ